MTVSLVRLADAAPQPWRNGGGSTRELARRPLEGEFDWRLSVAEVGADGPFSEFPGIDRVLVLLRGEGMTLCFTDDGSTVRLDRPVDLVHFAGERPVEARLHGGATTDLNLMWRRGRVTTSYAVVDAEPADAPLDMPVDVPADVLEEPVTGRTVLVVVVEGAATLASGEVLAVGDALVVRDDRAPRLAGAARLLHVLID